MSQQLNHSNTRQYECDWKDLSGFIFENKEIFITKKNNEQINSDPHSGPAPLTLMLTCRVNYQRKDIWNDCRQNGWVRSMLRKVLVVVSVSAAIYLYQQ